MRSLALLAVVSLVAGVTIARADHKPTPTKGFWNVLVKPGAKWTLRGNMDPPSRLVIETYDVRKVGSADVARLRWTMIAPDGKRTDAGDTETGRPTQIAVTSAGLYLMWATMDDAKVTAFLAQKPSRSDPPKPYKGTAKNAGRYLEVEDDGSVCLGQGAVHGDGCDDNCNGAVCISRTAGIVAVEGVYAPDNALYTPDTP
jgi:hypothetical protein